MEHLFFFSIYVSLKSIKTTNTDSRRRFQTEQEQIDIFLVKMFYTLSKKVFIPARKQIVGM